MLATKLPDEAPKPKRLTLTELADVIDSRFINGCRNLGGAFAEQAWLLVEADEIAALEQISATLRAMVPHTDALRRLVAGNKR